MATVDDLLYSNKLGLLDAIKKAQGPDPSGGLNKVLAGLAGVAGVTLGLPALGGFIGGLGSTAATATAAAIPGPLAGIGSALTTAGTGAQGWWNAYQVGQNSYNTGKVGDSLLAVGADALKKKAESEILKQTMEEKAIFEKTIKQTQLREWIKLHPEYKKFYIEGPGGEMLSKKKDVTADDLMAHQNRMEQQRINLEAAKLRLEALKSDPAVTKADWKSATNYAKSLLTSKTYSSKAGKDPKEIASFETAYQLYYIDKIKGMNPTTAPVMHGGKRGPFGELQSWDYTPLYQPTGTDTAQPAPNGGKKATSDGTTVRMKDPNGVLRDVPSYQAKEAEKNGYILQ